METISYQTIPFPPPEGFAATVRAAGNHIVSAPDNWEVDNAEAVLSIFNSYSGSDTELNWYRQNEYGTGKLDQLANLYTDKYAAGFNYDEYTFQIDARSQGNIDGQATAALGSILNNEVWDTNSYFVAADNSRMPLPTAETARTFSLAAHNYIADLILHNRTLKDEVSAATTMAELEAIDINSGWPANP